MSVIELVCVACEYTFSQTFVPDESGNISAEVVCSVCGNTATFDLEGESN